MKALIIYDSLFGNTQKVAEAIAQSFRFPDKVKLVKVADASVKDLEEIELLIIGSPTHGGRAKQELPVFFGQIADSGLKGVNLAVFDTRFLEKDQFFALRLLMKTIGYAAPKIAGILTKKGGKLILPPEGFIVKGEKGPLADDELKRAQNWGKKLQSLI